MPKRQSKGINRFIRMYVYGWLCANVIVLKVPQVTNHKNTQKK